ncbi:MAG: NAD(P)-binding protein, partial [Pelagibacteraceae bacterium]
MIDYCIVGSGIAGSTIANLLSKKYSVEVIDKARGPGGRASNRRYKKNLSFDHGLQYIAPKSKNFINFLNQLEKKKIIKNWQGNHLDFNFEKKDNIKKYIGFTSNNSIPKHLLNKLKTHFQSEVTNIKFNSNHWVININNNQNILSKNLILTCPYPQLKKLSFKYLKKEIASINPQMIANITTMFVYKNLPNLPISSIKFNDELLGWAANENSKERFKSKETLWTIQCSQKYSKKIIDKFKLNKLKYMNEIAKRFEEITGISSKNIILKSIHGWRYAFGSKKTKLDCVWSKKYKL